MIQTILGILHREIRECIADKRRFIFLFGAAAAYLIVFGILYMPNIVKHVPCVIFDEEQSYTSRQLIQDFDDSDSFRIVEYARSVEEMNRALKEKKAYVAVQIPRDFSKQIKTGRSSKVLLMINGSNIILTNITSSAAQNITADFSNRLAVQRTALATGSDAQSVAKYIAPVECQYRVMNNTTQGYTFFFLIGLAMVAFQQGILFCVGAAMTFEYKNGGFAYPRWLLMGVKAVFYWLLSMLSYTLVIVLAHVLWGIPVKAPFIDLFSLGGSFCFAAIGFCMLVASLFRTEMQFIRMIIMYPVPAFIFSGYTWPGLSMTPFLQMLAKLFPLSYLSDTARNLFLWGHSPSLYHNVGILCLLGAVCLAGAYVTFGWGMKRYSVIKSSGEKT
ncbi:MAG: ABC transporter permease [Megasphaera sp.]|nr:ABC transporter permease [Megasphaera sp.]MCH4188268.1 ABC transporter permease [Megasphaera sp.]MCH4218042.1 ABC transporter permease [Megasphaera sp.]